MRDFLFQNLSLFKSYSRDLPQRNFESPAILLKKNLITRVWEIIGTGTFLVPTIRFVVMSSEIENWNLKKKHAICYETQLNKSLSRCWVLSNNGFRIEINKGSRCIVLRCPEEDTTLAPNYNQRPSEP